MSEWECECEWKGTARRLDSTPLIDGTLSLRTVLMRNCMQQAGRGRQEESTETIVSFVSVCVPMRIRIRVHQVKKLDTHKKLRIHRRRWGAQRCDSFGGEEQKEQQQQQQLWCVRYNMWPVIWTMFSTKSPHTQTHTHVPFIYNNDNLWPSSS